MIAAAGRDHQKRWLRNITTSVFRRSTTSPSSSRRVWAGRLAPKPAPRRVTRRAGRLRSGQLDRADPTSNSDVNQPYIDGQRGCPSLSASSLLKTTGAPVRSSAGIAAVSFPFRQHLFVGDLQVGHAGAGRLERRIAEAVRRCVRPVGTGHRSLLSRPVTGGRRTLRPAAGRIRVNGTPAFSRSSAGPFSGAPPWRSRSAASRSGRSPGRRRPCSGFPRPATPRRRAVPRRHRPP